MTTLPQAWGLSRVKLPVRSGALGETGVPVIPLPLCSLLGESTIVTFTV